MKEELVESIQSSETSSLAAQFSRIGRIGFILQLVVGIIPIILVISSFLVQAPISGRRTALPLMQWLTIAGVLVLIFTTYWFWSYTRLAKRIDDPATRPPQSALVAKVWTGILASSTGIIFSIIVMVVEVSILLYYFLIAPQGGIPVMQMTEQASWISAIDMLSLLALVLVIVAEILVLVLGLWLLFRTSQGCQEFA
ncbi:MAG: DUF3611 family protein [Chromatiaceae bacterium]|nr:MAG: DUF3611 family protein [Chromatiaceae bacterium]